MSDHSHHETTSQPMNNSNSTSPSNVVTPSKISLFATPLAVVAAGIIIAAAVLVTGKTNPQVPLANNGIPAQAPSYDSNKIALGDSPVIGNTNAPLLVGYWFDYQCPFCKQNEQQSMSNLMKDYVAAGKIRIVFKDFEFLGPDSDAAGIIARAVWDVAPDKFYAWHKAMFDKQDTENGGWGKKEDILALTNTIAGIDGARVAQLATQNAAKYKAAIDADKDQGAKLGISGTPALVIGTTLVSGAEPYENIKAAIDAALNK